MEQNIEFVHLRADGVSVVLANPPGTLPAMVHWGADLGPLTRDDCLALWSTVTSPPYNEMPDEPGVLTLLPSHQAGWSGRPGISGSRSGEAWSTRFRRTQTRLDDRPVGDFVEAGNATVTVTAADEDAALDLRLTIELCKGGALRTRASVTNIGSAGYQVNDLVIAYRVPEEAREVLDLAGHWGKERVPQRRALTVGTHLREGRHGHTGPDAATVLHVGTRRFSFRSGRVWGVHVGWSGNHTHYAERVLSGEQVLGGGELLWPGEIVLDHGETYTTPWVYGSFGHGLDQVARRFHDFLRSRDTHVDTERPVTLNTWEAVYFDHDQQRLIDLAERAANLGVERFVLDDGWFGARRNSRAGLGDWTVSPDAWPQGLHPLVDRVRELGMQFGLWLEPEMVNPDSDLARTHPEWIMQTGGRLPVTIRSQQVLNLANAECYAAIRDQIVDLLKEYRIDYIKWDHNRDLIEAGDALRGGRPRTHAQTQAFYRLVDELKAYQPGLEIESCSAGGSRVDLGVMEHVDRVWNSDCNDPLERQQINMWTNQLVPLELMGTHVASRRSHTTGRTHDLSFRAATALFGHLGLEWDLARADPEELREMAEWITFYKNVRNELFRGDLVRSDFPDDSIRAFGIVRRDRSGALYQISALATSEVSSPGRIPLPGLDPTRRYHVTPIPLSTNQRMTMRPHWWPVDSERTAAGNVMLTGAMLEAGLMLPGLPPESAIVLRVEEAP